MYLTQIRADFENVQSVSIKKLKSTFMYCGNIFTSLSKYNFVQLLFINIHILWLETLKNTHTPMLCNCGDARRKMTQLLWRNKTDKHSV